jgi:hypothetical protein
MVILRSFYIASVKYESSSIFTLYRLTPADIMVEKPAHNTSAFPGLESVLKCDGCTNEPRSSLEKGEQCVSHYYFSA